jgi:hypothetical protein
VHARRGSGLGQEHGSELARAYDADSYGTALSLPLKQHLMEIQPSPPFIYFVRSLYVIGPQPGGGHKRRAVSNRCFLGLKAVASC